MPSTKHAYHSSNYCCFIRMWTGKRWRDKLNKKRMEVNSRSPRSPRISLSSSELQLLILPKRRNTVNNLKKLLVGIISAVMLNVAACGPDVEHDNEPSGLESHALSIEASQSPMTEQGNAKTTPGSPASSFGSCRSCCMDSWTCNDDMNPISCLRVLNACTNICRRNPDAYQC